MIYSSITPRIPIFSSINFAYFAVSPSQQREKTNRFINFYSGYEYSAAFVVYAEYAK